MVTTAFEGYARLALAVPVVLIGLALAPEAAAQSVPKGLTLGPWIIAPSFSTSYEADSNVFFEEEGEDDRVTTYRGDLRAVMPFRNSELRLDYEASKEQYENTPFDRDVTQAGSIDLKLNFRSGDSLRLRDTYRRDYARADREDLPPETEAFRGEPFSFNRWEAELSRTDPRRQGYVINVRRQDFIYDGTLDVGFLEYRGFDNTFEFRKPQPNDRAWVARYESRRFDYFRASEAVGIPVREEATDAVLFGVRGFLGDDQPYRLHLGYSRFRYTGELDSRFDGLVGTAAWALRLGDRTSLDLEAIRRPLPSNLETHYINNAIRAELKREWRSFDAGSELSLSENNYAGPIGGCAGTRHDVQAGVEIYGSWRLHERMKLKASTFHKVRSSNCEQYDYAASGLETGISLGWF